MIRYFVIIGLLGLFSDMSARGESLSLDTADKVSKIGIRADINFMKVTGNSDFKTAGLNGGIQLDYNVTDKFFVNTYIGYMTDMSEKSRQFVNPNDGKIYDLTTSKMFFYGLGAGYRLFSDGRFSFYSDVRIGLGHSEVKEIFASLNNNYVLKRSMAMFMPRANFSYRIGKFRRIEPGVSFTYIFPIGLNGKVDQYDLGNVNSGIFCTFHF